MRHLMRLFAAPMLAISFAGTAAACPLCKDAAEAAIDAAGEQNFNDDPLAEARAYNRSIYFMIGVPYTIFAVGGIYCYRNLRQKPEIV